MKYNFYKTNDGYWFIDLPEYVSKGGNIADLAMVAGADILLDILAKGKNKISVLLTSSFLLDPDVVLSRKFNGITEAELEIHKHLSDFTEGSYYTAKIYNPIRSEMILWLCPVTMYVFEGIYPTNIYVKILDYA